MYGFLFSTGVFPLFISHFRYIEGDDSVYGPQYLGIYYGLQSEEFKVPFHGGNIAAVHRACECIFVCTLVYVCLSVREGPTGAVQFPMCMGRGVLCVVMSVCLWPGVYLFSMHLVCLCVGVCACVHTSTCT